MPQPECVKSAGREVIQIPGYDLTCTRLTFTPWGYVKYYIAFQLNGEAISPFRCTIPTPRYPDIMSARSYRLLRNPVNNSDSETELPLK